MELTISHALQQRIAAHKEGKLQDAERFYRSILQVQPGHGDVKSYIISADLHPV